VYFIYLYENRAMNLVEIILIRGKGVRENDESSVHIWKRDKDPPLCATNIC
jgi:hypothetical protein